MGGSTELGRGHITLSADDVPLKRGLSSARASLGGFLREVGTGITQGLGQALFQSITRAVGSAIDEIGKSVKAASDLSESVNKISVAFGDSAQDIYEWSKTSATAMGQSQQGALEAASTFGLLFSTMGVGREASAEMSKGLVQLASDLASIQNSTPEEALIKLRAGLVGEAEPLRVWGVLLDEATTSQKAMQLGLADTAKELTAQDKVMARYQLILEQTALSQGDFARTSGGLANSQRTLTAQIADARAELGRTFEPIALAFTRGLSLLLTTVRPYGVNIMDSLAQGLAAGITNILPVLAQIRALFAYWLQPGSPPRLLRELTEWGRSAMQEYLAGWTTADLGALKQLGSSIEGVLRSFVGSGAIAEVDLVGRVFGSQKAITQAIRDFRDLGHVTEATFAAIADNAGPAGGAIAGLVREYFELQKATQKVTDAQDELNAITQTYADALSPLQGELDAVRAKQQQIRDNQRLEALGKVLKDPRATADEKALALLEAQEIALNQQVTAIQNEQEVAVDAANIKVAAAEEEQAAQQEQFDMAQAVLDQQIKVNDLVSEEAALRQRLADEAIAAQAKALADLEAEQRKLEAADQARLADLERIYQAQLAYSLATTDTAGQLALLQAELGRTTKGSAEYYDMLTRVYQLEQKLKDERESTADGGAGGPLAALVDSPVLQEASAGITALSAALDEAFKVLAGGEGTKVELNPAWQGFADMMGTIGEAVQEVTPFIQGIIDLVMGKDPTTTGGEGGDPFGDNFWLAGLVPFLDGLLLTLQQMVEGDWAAVWQRFKWWMSEQFMWSAENGSDTFPMYKWIVNVLIPLLENLWETDWAAVWTKFATTVTGTWDGIVTYVEAGVAKLVEAIKKVKDLWNSLPGEGGGTNLPGESQDVLPGNNFSSFNGVLPLQLQPAMASSSTFNSGAAIVNNIQINQAIGMNDDVGGARQGAKLGVREALIGRRLNA